jgi:hypothetical protein
MKRRGTTVSQEGRESRPNIARGSELVIGDHRAGRVHFSLGPGPPIREWHASEGELLQYTASAAVLPNPLVFRPDPFLERGVGAQGCQVRVAVGHVPSTEPLLGCLPQQSHGTTLFAQQPRNACAPV